MNLETLYANYGKASVALEIAQGQYNEAKKALAEALNKQEAPKVEPKE